jgi:hypothetical protein
MCDFGKTVRLSAMLRTWMAAHTVAARVELLAVEAACGFSLSWCLELM